ncbi:hypothetical protein ABW21_db0209030 [Orbilia brochopaga]|nr:hypothetical protein ABW21_db0209030 [Drechslerella brochopaga]
MRTIRYLCGGQNVESVIYRPLSDYRIHHQERHKRFMDYLVQTSYDRARSDLTRCKDGIGSPASTEVSINDTRKACMLRWEDARQRVTEYAELLRIVELTIDDAPS